MATGPDLFVVCQQCGSEVSPYITECPYCGHRLRQRAPKLPRANSRGGALRRFVHRPAFARLRSPSARSTRTGSSRYGYSLTASRPYATIALVGFGCVAWIAVRGGYIGFFKLAIVGPLHGDWWKLLSSQFAYLNGLYAFVTLLAIAIFGWLLERRRGPAIVLALFFGGGVTGALAASAVYAEPIVSGANGAALALLAAWAIPDLAAARGGSYYDGDLLGTGALAATLLVIPYARPEVSWLAGVVGGAFGLTVGLGLRLIDPPEL